MKVINPVLKMIDMKKIKLIFPFILISLSLISCLKEDFIPEPSVQSLKMYMSDIDGRDSLVTEATSKKTLKFVVETEADICSIWPGGIRTVMKKKGSTIDSLDMFNHPVLVKSDCFSDYGLVGARGYKSTQTNGGWYVSYVYPAGGDFDLTIVVTNHGYESSEYKQVIINYGTITVK